MIQAEFFTNPRGELLGFSINGHSGYGESGSDIVCAAVSSAAYMTVNAVTDVLGVQAQVSAVDGFLRIRVDGKDAKDCRVLFSGFKLHMLWLEEQYPQNIQVCYTEV